MQAFRELRAFAEEHGHTRVAEVRGADDALARWTAAAVAQARDGQLSPKRRAYLAELALLADGDAGEVEA